MYNKIHFLITVAEAKTSATVMSLFSQTHIQSANGPCPLAPNSSQNGRFCSVITAWTTAAISCLHPDSAEQPGAMRELGRVGESLVQGQAMPVAPSVLVCRDPPSRFGLILAITKKSC